MCLRALLIALGAALAFPAPVAAVRLDDVGSQRPVETIPADASTLEVAVVAATLIDSVSDSSDRPAASGDDLEWPIGDTVNTYFGGGHDGIDIEGETGDPIEAAGSGRITFAGDDGDGYGTKIVISHGSGISTLYSHLDDMKVTKGWVEQGDVIGTVGCTGSCTGDHLHFEIQRGGTPVDPLDVLP